MFSSAGFSSPRGPFAGAAPLAHRPLSAIAATTAGGVPQKRIQRVLAELLPVLEELHQQGRLCGDISVHSVGMDEDGRAHLMALSGPPRTSDNLTLIPGYAPFELYTEASDWPRGPWTDIYALSAVAHSLVTGQRPPAAPERRVSDTYRPLAAQDLPRYDADFLAAIDAGLAMRPAERPQTLQAYAALMALPATPVAAPVASHDAEPAAPAYQADVYAGPRRSPARSMIKTLLLAAATVGVAAYWWGRLTETPSAVITYSEPVVPRAEVGAPAASAAEAEPGAAAASSGTPEVSVIESAPANPATGQMAEASPRLASESDGADAPPTVVPTPTPASAPAATEEALEAGNAADAKPQPATPPVAPVSVSINVRPWGEIIINGVSRGVTPPLKTLRLAPGRYAITIRNSAQSPHRMTLDVKAGKPAIISHVFR